MINQVDITNKPKVDLFKKNAISSIDTNISAVKSCTNTLSSTTIKPSTSFGNSAHVSINTTLRNQDEQQKFSQVASLLNSSNKAKLNTLLKNGKLLNNDSNDKSTTLDNLYKIATTPRAQGLNTKTILADVITALDNPFAITQKFGDIPTPIANEILTNQSKYATREPAPSNYMEALKQNGRLPNFQPITKDLLNVISSSCVAASIQFNLAHKNPAEYTRLAQGLTSPECSVTKNIKLAEIAPGAVDAMWLLNQFKVPHKQLNWDNVEVTMKPDKNAIVRAQIQSSPKYKDEGERSPVDVLMQSTFMNIGSQHTYNSITDIRTGAFNPDNRGLTDIEKNLAEVIAEGKNKISVTYQILDESGKIIGYECPQENTLKHIKEALKMGENVIIGYTHTDANNRVINGHEITIVGVETDKKGKEVFICNDTDDFKNTPVKYDVKYLLPKIHHAGLPHAALKEDVQIVDGWVDVLNQYKNAS